MFRVAVCDDQNIMHIMIKSQLKRYSEEKGIAFDITDYMSGDEFLADCSEGGEYDLIISDINMPGTDGIDTIKALRKKQSKPVPVIFQSSWFDSERLTLELLPWQFIDKPIIWDKFSPALTRCIDIINEQ